MAASEDRWSIDRLTSANYATWKFQMKHLLIAKGLYFIVDGTEKAPAESAEAKEKSEYLSRSQRAFSNIALSVSSELVYIISDSEDPHDAWTKLKKHFERNTLANKLFLKKTVL